MSQGPNRMKNSDKPIAHLIRDYILEMISDEDRQTLDNWMKTKAENTLTFKTATNNKVLTEGVDLLDEMNVPQKLRDVKSKLRFTDAPSMNGHAVMPSIQPIDPAEEAIAIRQLRIGQRRRQWLVAACVVLLAGLGLTFFLARPGANSNLLRDIPPGGAKAFLTLEDGSEIIIQNEQDGILASTGDSRVIKEKGLVRYTSRNRHGKPEYHTFNTPLTGNYALLLSDGTRLTLNAGSSVTYPTEFTGKQRKVVMSGEVYFEVNTVLSPDGAKIPFIVEVKDRGVTVEVVGTKFNVNSYNNEPVRTTLDEGSIIVATATEKQVMTPGQQSVINDSGIMLKELGSRNVAAAAHAWKNNQFDFKKADIPTMMKEVARWYDITVEFHGPVPDREFNGSFSRNQPLSEVLKVLEKAGKVKTKREQHKLIISVK